MGGAPASGYLNRSFDGFRKVLNVVF